MYSYLRSVQDSYGYIEVFPAYFIFWIAAYPVNKAQHLPFEQPGPGDPSAITNHL